jgi:hypothetical protein
MINKNIIINMLSLVGQSKSHAVIFAMLSVEPYKHIVADKPAMQ